MNSTFYWDKFSKTGKIADYLAYRYPDPAVIKHNPNEGAAYFPRISKDGGEA